MSVKPHIASPAFAIAAPKLFVGFHSSHSSHEQGIFLALVQAEVLVFSTGLYNMSVYSY